MIQFRDNSSVGLSADREPVKRLPVRRNLFGTPTPEKQATDFLTQEIRLDATERFVDKWGFDPLQGIPVENGKLEWTPVENKEDAPSFYFKGYAPRKSKPVHGTRRERPYSTPCRRLFPLRPLKREHISQSQQEDGENDNISDSHFWGNKVVIVNTEFESLLSTPKPLRLSSPSDLSSQSGQNVDPSSSTNYSSCSISGLRSRSVSNNSVSSSSGLINSCNNGSLKQQTLDDHFQVKKPRCLMMKSLPKS